MYKSTLPTSPLITTIIPAFNAERWIAEAIDSALIQGVNQEILVINDGSTDKTDKIASEYPPPVRLINKYNGGVSSARNEGLRQAKGEFIAFLDADDVWLPGKLSKQLSALRDFPSAGTVVCDETHVNKEKKTVLSSFFATKSFSHEIPKKIDLVDKPLTWLATESFFPTSGVLTKRICVQQAGFFDETLSIVEDRDYWIRLAIISPIVIIPEVMLRYRIDNPVCLSIVGQKIWAKNVLTVLVRHLELLEKRIELEGGDLKNSLGNSFETIAESMWNSGNYKDSAEAFGLAAMYGRRSYIKRIVANIGIAPTIIDFIDRCRKTLNIGK